MQKPSSGSPLHESKWLTAEDFKFLCYEMAVQFLSFSEPIPDYETRDNNLLESALSSPRQTYGGHLLYPTLIQQAAILFYSLIKNHPFLNGNKRIAVMSLFAFLMINDKWISVIPHDLYILATKVSESFPKEKDKTLKDIKNFLEKNIVPKKHEPQDD